ncbi:hypothetical protein [Sphingobium scionense]|uniref:hypothetical protein n=1 Tax=Sphingobium scionense TaxID=1404341 RepID=UPI001FE53D61|nr:hypothetical protein [Sphingobium scionense]
MREMVAQLPDGFADIARKGLAFRFDQELDRLPADLGVNQRIDPPTRSDRNLEPIDFGMAIW